VKRSREGGQAREKSGKEGKKGDPCYPAEIFRSKKEGGGRGDRRSKKGKTIKEDVTENRGQSQIPREPVKKGEPGTTTPGGSMQDRRQTQNS